MPITSHLSYLQRQAFCPLQIEEAPAPNLGLVVVIPCHNEPDLESSLNALWNCQRPGAAVEVIVVINAGIKDSPEIHQQNESCLESARQWANAHLDSGFRCHILYFPELPPKHAGVGLARKIGMDEAVGRLAAVGRNEGPIVCFDADSACDPNYLIALESHFQSFPKTPACSVYYEHPLNGPLEPAVYQGITLYELYLRYYVEGLRYSLHPYAFHTIGSSMAVRSSVYQSQGGMNRRKAGEDFHFLQKLIPLGHYSEVNSTRVIPSPRLSDRVPFGTGKAISDWVADPDPNYPVYAVSSFADLRVFQERVWKGYGQSHEALSEGLAPPLAAYLQKVEFAKNWKETHEQTTSESMFYKRFFRWWNGLRVLQYFHFARDQYAPNEAVTNAARELLILSGETPPSDTPSGLLTAYRTRQRNSAYTGFPPF